MAVIKQKHQRVAVFIDVQNMYYSARAIYGTHVHFGNIVEAAVGGRPLIRAIAYVVRAGIPEEQGFFDALVKLGIETKERELKTFYDGNKKADWDVGIVVDAIRLSPKLDVVILVSGDGDYVPMLEYLKNSGVQTEVVAFRESTSSELVAMADDFTDLSAAPEKFLINYRGRRRSPSRAAPPSGPAPKRPSADVDPNILSQLDDV